MKTRSSKKEMFKDPLKSEKDIAEKDIREMDRIEKDKVLGKIELEDHSDSDFEPDENLANLVKKRKQALLLVDSSPRRKRGLKNDSSKIGLKRKKTSKKGKPVSSADTEMQNDVIMTNFSDDSEEDEEIWISTMTKAPSTSSDLVIQIVDEPSKPPEKSKNANRQTKSSKETAKGMKLASRLHLFFSLMHGIYVTKRYGNSRLLQSLMLSIVPSAIVKDLSCDNVNLDNILHLLHWFKSTWRKVDSDENQGDLGLYSLWKCIRLREYPNEEYLVILCFCLLRAIRFECRFMLGIEPFSKSYNNLKCTNTKGSGTIMPPLQWIEVWFQNSWVSLDCIRAIINDPFAMEPSSQTLAYVLAFEPLILRDSKLRGARGKFLSRIKVSDVTFRYASDYHGLVRKMRGVLDEKAMSLLLDELSLPQMQKRAQEHYDELELKKKYDTEPLPSSISSYNNHPKYVLERYLKQFEVLKDKEKAPILGYCRGEPVFPRSCVAQVKARENWIKLARSIKPGEEPAKFIKRRKKPKPKSEFSSSKRVVELSSSSENEDEDENENENESKTPKYNPKKHTALFGEWQTEDYVPPPVIDGVIPRNVFNNLEIFQPSMIPTGCVHLVFPKAAALAKRLSLQYVEAVTGFTFSRFSSYPTIEGIVVLEKDQEILLTAYEEQLALEESKSVKNREQRILRRWKSLYRMAILRERVKKTFEKTT